MLPFHNPFKKTLESLSEIWLERIPTTTTTNLLGSYSTEEETQCSSKKENSVEAECLVEQLNFKEEIEGQYEKMSERI